MQTGSNHNIKKAYYVWDKKRAKADFFLMATILGSSSVCSVS